MGILELVQLAALALQTITKMQADGRAQTTAEELASLKSAVAEADAADAEWNALPGGTQAPPLPPAKA